MKTLTYTIKDELGIHARPAGLLVKEADKFVSDVEIITLDSNGRFLIPKRYLKIANIEQDVRIIGMDDTIEIWSKKVADKPFMSPEDFGRELEAIMGTPPNL